MIHGKKNYLKFILFPFIGYEKAFVFTTKARFVGNTERKSFKTQLYSNCVNEQLNIL